MSEHMKTLFKVLGLLIAAIAAVVITLSLVFYYSPGLQRRVVLMVLDQPGLAAELEFVSIRLSHTEIRGLQINSAEESLRLDSLEARYSIRGAFSNRLQLELLNVTGLEIDVASAGGQSLVEGFGGNPDTAGEPGGAHSPMQIEVGKVRIAGSALLPGNIGSTFEVKMDNIRPSSAGALAVELLLLPTGPGVEFERIEFALNGALHQSAAGTFDRLEGDLVARMLESPGAEWVEARMHQRFEASAGSFDLVVDEMQLRKGASRLLDGALKATGRRADGGAWIGDYSVRMNSDLAQVSALSIVPIKEPLSSGRLEGQLAGEFHKGERVTANGVLEVRELRPAGYSGRALSLKLDPELEGQPATGKLVFSTPIRLVGPASATTGTFATTLDPGADGRQRFDAQLLLDAFSLDEWQPIIASLSAKEPAAPAPRDTTPDSESPWSGLEGNAVARINRLQAGGNIVTDITASIRIEAGQTLQAELTGQSGQSPLKSVATVQFQPDRPARPYTLSGLLDVQGLDVAPFLRQPGSNKPLILEGIFNANGTFQSNAPNLSLLAENATGEFLLQSASNGIFRPLGEKTSLATGLSGIIGALAGNRKEVGWVQQVIDQLKEIPFTQMSFRMGREQNLDFFLRELDLISRETRIKGSGIFHYKENAPLLQFPMDLRFELFAKGRLAEALRSGNQLRSEQPDAMGFYPGPPLPMRGSLARPESLLINLLMESGSQLLPGLLRP